MRVESYNFWPWVKLFVAIINTLDIHFHLCVHALTLLRLSGKSFWTELRNYRSFHQTQKLRKPSDSIWNLSQRFASLAIKCPHVSIKTCGDLGHLLVLNYKKFIKKQKLKPLHIWFTSRPGIKKPNALTTWNIPNESPHRQQAISVEYRPGGLNNSNKTGERKLQLWWIKMLTMMTTDDIIFMPREDTGNTQIQISSTVQRQNLQMTF